MPALQNHFHCFLPYYGCKTQVTKSFTHIPLKCLRVQFQQLCNRDSVQTWIAPHYIQDCNQCEFIKFDLELVYFLQLVCYLFLHMTVTTFLIIFPQLRSQFVTAVTLRSTVLKVLHGEKNSEGSMFTSNKRLTPKLPMQTSFLFTCANGPSGKHQERAIQQNLASHICAYSLTPRLGSFTIREKT